jgi:chromate reductase, NAD(P)H dehydrogenase (quinone)
VSQPADRDPVAPPPTVLVFNGSSRTGSFNRQLAMMIVDGLVGRDIDARLVDLADSGLPLFHADLNASEGQPPAAHDLQAEIASADGLVIVSPEYNGAMTPLLKNTIDWVSRVDMTTLYPKKVALAAATPGRRGGAHVLDLTSQWLPYMGADVFPETFGLPSVRHTMVDGQLLDGHDERLAAFLDAVAAWFREPSVDTA